MQHWQVTNYPHPLLGGSAQYGVEPVPVHGGAFPHYLPGHSTFGVQAIEVSAPASD
jgi:hypothetical protein